MPKQTIVPTANAVKETVKKNFGSFVIFSVVLMVQKRVLCRSSNRIRKLQQSPARALQPVDDHQRHALVQFAAELPILLAQLAEPGAVKENGFCGLNCPRIEMPGLGLEEPGPA